MFLHVILLCLVASIPLIQGLALPAQELINRRKSPALWRYDLSHNDEDQQQERQQKPSSFPLQRPPEVMSPVGGWPQLYAAIANGADAIYIGLNAFSARARAANFDAEEELPEAVQTCHDANVKLYVALNTLVFPAELEEVEGLIRQCAKAKVDALIVQDLGVARLARKVAPSLELHASTQQTITSADGAEFIAGWMGSTRVVLGRELSVAEIESVAAKLQHNSPSSSTSNGLPPVEVEAFVHGALCVSYSGQCFSSEAWGGRSANRGQCAQACRLPYGLVDNGVLSNLGDLSYLLSPQDLCGLDQVPDLVRAGVACLKIEGRLKDPAYVAATTRAYRQAVDKAWKEYVEELDDAPPEFHHRPISHPDVHVSKAELAQVFSRGQDEAHDGLSSGFFEGSRHQNLVRGRSPRHRGVHVGRVSEGTSWRKGLMIALDDNNMSGLKRGDGLVVDRGLAQEEELGGPIFDVEILPELHDGKQVAMVQFSKAVQKKWRRMDDDAWKAGNPQPDHVPVAAHVWRTSDATVDKKLKKLSEAHVPTQLKRARVVVEGSIGEPLVVTIHDLSTARQGVGKSEGVLQTADKKGLDQKSIQKAVGLLGNTEWELSAINTADVPADAWCPASWIKEARRQAVEDLQSKFDATTSAPEENVSDQRSTNAGVGSVTRQILNSFSNQVSYVDEQESTSAKFSVLARNYAQVDAICRLIERGQGIGIDEIIVDFLEVEGMRDAVERIREVSPVKAVVASPRVIKPGECGIWQTLLRLEPDGLLVRSTGLLHRMMELGGEGALIDVGVLALEGEEDSPEVEERSRQVLCPSLIGDFSLNTANAISCWELLSYGCSRVTASFDLNANGITELLESMGNIDDGAAKIDIVAHAHLPVFHTEHCVFARFLSKGNSYLDCGHVCTSHNVHLRDQNGQDNLVLADMGCRNTVFGSEAQSGVHSLKDWEAAGASRFRIELVDEGPDDVEMIIKGYLAVLDGSERASALWETLKLVEDSNGRMGGVSHGSFRNSKVRRAGEIE